MNPPVRLAAMVDAWRMGSAGAKRRPGKRRAQATRTVSSGRTPSGPGSHRLTFMIAPVGDIRKHVTPPPPFTSNRSPETRHI